MKTQITLKRLLGLLVAFALVMTQLPIAAFASEEPSDGNDSEYSDLDDDDEDEDLGDDDEDEDLGDDDEDEDLGDDDEDEDLDDDDEDEDLDDDDEDEDLDDDDEDEDLGEDDEVKDLGDLDDENKTTRNSFIGENGYLVDDNGTQILDENGSAIDFNSGDYSLNDDGELVDAQGNLVLDSNGQPITVTFALATTLEAGLDALEKVPGFYDISLQADSSLLTQHTMMYSIELEQTDDENSLQNAVLELVMDGEHPEALVLSDDTLAEFARKGFTYNGAATDSETGAMTFSFSYNEDAFPATLSLANLKFVYDPSFNLKTKTSIADSLTVRLSGANMDVQEETDSFSGFTLTVYLLSAVNLNITDKDTTKNQFDFDLDITLGKDTHPEFRASQHKAENYFDLYVQFYHKNYGTNNIELLSVDYTPIEGISFASSHTWKTASNDSNGAYTYFRVRASVEDGYNIYDAVAKGALKLSLQFNDPTITGALANPSIAYYGLASGGSAKIFLTSENNSNVTSEDPTLTLQGFRKVADNSNYRDLISQSNLTGNGYASVGFHLYNTDTAEFRVKNSTDLKKLFVVDEVEAYEGADSWEDTGYSDFYYGRNGITSVKPGAFHYTDDTGAKQEFPVGIYVKVYDTQAGQYVSFAKDNFSLYGSDYYFARSYTFSGGNGATHSNQWNSAISRSSLLGYLGMSSTDRNAVNDDGSYRYIIQGTLWDFSANGTVNAPSTMRQHKVDKGWAMSLYFTAQVKDSSTATLERIEQELPQDDPMYNNAKLSYGIASTSGGPGSGGPGIDPVYREQAGAGVPFNEKQEYINASLSKHNRFDLSKDSWSQWDTANRRDAEFVQWRVRLTNKTDSTASFRSLQDGTVIIRDYLPAIVQNAVSGVEIRVYAPGETVATAGGTLVDKAYYEIIDGGTVSAGMVGKGLNASYISAGAGDGLVDFVINLGDSNSAVWAGGLKPGCTVQVCFNTLMAENIDNLKSGTYVNQAATVSFDELYNATYKEDKFTGGNTQTYYSDDINGNGSTGDDVLASRAQVTIADPEKETTITGLTVNKLVSIDGSGFFKSLTGLEPGQQYWYRLQVRSSVNAFTDITVKDVLPAPGDRYFLKDSDRLSAWAPVVSEADLLDSMVIAANATTYDVTADGANGSFKLECVTDGDGNVTGFTLTAPDGFVLNKGSFLTVTFAVNAPEEEEGVSLDHEMANNSFLFTGKPILNDNGDKGEEVSKEANATITIIVPVPEEPETPEKPETPTTPDRDRDSGGRGPDGNPTRATTIPDADVPLTQPPFTIADEETPLAKLPQTGKAAKTAAGAGALLMGLAAMLALKKKDEAGE